MICHRGPAGPRLRAWAFLALALLAARATAAALSPQPNTQLIQAIDTEEKEDHADITVQFACTVHYITNLPLNHGSRTRITLRLGPDCGPARGGFPPEIPIVGGGGRLVTNAELESTVPGEVVLELTWSRDFDFVMAPSDNGLGLRVRLIGTGRRKGSVYISEPQAPEGYAVNLES